MKELNINTLHVKTLHVHNEDFSVYGHMVYAGVLINIPAIVLGDFECANKSLTTLKNGPKEVHGYFSCSSNSLTSLEFGPEVVKGSYFCNNNKLTSLKGCVKRINQNFDCSHNKLTSLKYGPEYVANILYIESNNLTTLEFAPKGDMVLIRFMGNKEQLYIESKMVGKGYTNYWPDLLSYCVNENIDLSFINTWPEGFLTEEIIRSSKGLSKFGL